MLWDPSVLGPMYPEMCPGRNQQGRNPPAGGSCRQELRATHRCWGQTLHTSGVSPGREEEPSGRGDFSFFYPPAGAPFPWHPAGRCFSTDLPLRGVQQRGEGTPGCPSTMGTPSQREPGWRMLPRCHPDVPRCAWLDATGREVAPRGVSPPRCHLRDVALGAMWARGLCREGHVPG